MLGPEQSQKEVSRDHSLGSPLLSDEDGKCDFILAHEIHGGDREGAAPPPHDAALLKRDKLKRFVLRPQLNGG